MLKLVRGTELLQQTAFFFLRKRIRKITRIIEIRRSTILSNDSSFYCIWIHYPGSRIAVSNCSQKR